MAETNPLDKIRGESAAMNRVREMIEALAPTDLRVLVSGETGTGKELVINALHRLSGFASGPLVPVNCPELSSTLSTSALFGHRKGAFTDAKEDRRGVLETARDGSLFLDEVGDLPLEVQPVLLRVLETQTFSPLGGDSILRVRFRLLSATNRDLAKMSREGLYRPEFLHRIAEERILIPPLRERPEDIPVLARHFLSETAKETGIAPARIPDEAVHRLLQYSWPGNVRELRNRMRGLAVRFQGRRILPEDLEIHTPRSQEAYEQERGRIIECLVLTQGRIQEAARLLGLHRTTLWRQMAKLGIPRGTGRRS